jgi:hypothetical protein
MQNADCAPGILAAIFRWLIVVEQLKILLRIREALRFRILAAAMVMI